MHLACKPSSTATACEVTTLQRYRNVCIIINIIVAAVIFSPTTNHRVILQTSQSRSTISLFHYIFHFPVQAQYFPLHDLNIFTPNHCHPLCKRDHPISTCYFKCWIYLSHFTTKTNSQTFEYCINGFKDHWINSKTSNTISTSSQVQFKFAHLAALPRMQWRHWGCGPPRVTPSRGGDTRMELKILLLNLQRTLDKRGRNVGVVTRRQLKRSSLTWRWLKKGCQEKMGWHRQLLPRVTPTLVTPLQERTQLSK